MVTGQDVAEQQFHPYLGQGGHASAHDPHPSPCSGPGEILPWYAQKLSDGILVKAGNLAPPLVIFTLLTFLQDQWVTQELVEGISIKGDLLAPYP